MKRAGLLFLIPAVLVYGLTTVVPLLQVGRLSLFESDYIGTTWVGLANYRELFQDAAWFKALGVTARFLLLIVPLQTLLPLGIALVLTRMPKGWQTYARTMFYLPAFVSGLVMTAVWRWMWHPEYGIVNAVLGIVGIPPVYWLAGAWSASVAIAVIIISTTMGGTLVMYLAVMLGIRKELYEQAEVDGASPGQIRRLIVTPMVVPTILLVGLMDLVGALQIFYLPLTLTDGGPSGQTSTLMFLLYRTGFAMQRYGYANAQAMVLLVVVVALGAAAQLLQRRMAR